MSSTLRSTPTNSYAILANYQVSIAMPTWCRCILPILFWPWSPFNLFLFRPCAAPTCSTLNWWRGISLLGQELVSWVKNSGPPSIVVLSYGDSVSIMFITFVLGVSKVPFWSIGVFPLFSCQRIRVITHLFQATILNFNIIVLRVFHKFK